MIYLCIVIKKQTDMKPFRVKIVTDNDTFYSYRSSFASCMKYVARCMQNVYPCPLDCNVSYHIQKLDDKLNYNTISFCSFVSF